MASSPPLDPLAGPTLGNARGWRPRSGLVRWLLLAFGSIAALTVLAILLSEQSSQELNRSIAIVAEQSLPATSAALRLAKETATVAATAPRLADAPSLAAAEVARDRLNLELATVGTLADQVSGQSGGAAGLDPIVTAMRATLVWLQVHVDDRLTMGERLRRRLQAASALHQAIIAQATPLADDAEFALFQGLGPGPSERDPAAAITAVHAGRERLVRYANLAQVTTGANLALGLLTEAALTDDPALLEPLSDQFQSAVQELGNALASAGADPRIRSLGAAVAKLDPLGSGPSGIFELRRQQLVATAQSKIALAHTQVLTHRLDAEVNLLVASAEDAAHRAVAHAGATLTRAHLFQRGIAGGVIALAALLAFGVAARFRRTEARELRELAEAAFEAIVICRNGRISGANGRLAEMLGVTPPYGSALTRILTIPDGTELSPALARALNEPVAAVLHAVSGAIPVELRARVSGAGASMRQVLAIRDLRARAAAEARIRYLAYHDPLTGLGNRAHFKERLEQALAFARRSEQLIALVCIDLDGFKAVNDLYGHAAGDALLRETARRLQASVRESDAIARLGGDEFVVVQTGITTADAAGHLAERIVEALGEACVVGSDCVAEVTASVGVSLYPEDAEDAATLLAHADAALYRVKQGGRSGFAFFRPEMDADLRSRRLMEQDLRHAERLGQLVLEFQPEADCKTGRVLGFEALLRWRHPTRGLVPPAEFIPMAEDTGTIIPIGAFVLREACRAAATWSRPLSVAVNVSPVQLQQGDLPERVQEALALSGLAPGRLELEVTESVLIREAARARKMLEDVRALGVRVALDDFGTGYSSLGTLRSFPFDRIKIDRSFIGSLPAQDATTIMRAVLTLGRGLNMTVLAEGVETPDQLELLREMGCGQVQGYLIGRPQPIETWQKLTGDTPKLLAAV